jgi:hypothetical protein
MSIAIQISLGIEVRPYLKNNQLKKLYQQKGSSGGMHT